MEVNNHVLLIISISSLILSFSGEARIISPSPAESPSSSAPAPSPVSISYISSSPKSPYSPAPSPVSISYISSAPESPSSPTPTPAPAPSPVSVSHISSAPDSAPASSPSNEDQESPLPTPASLSYISSAPNSAPAPSPSNDDDQEFDSSTAVLLEKSITNGINGAEAGIRQAQRLLEDPSTPSKVGTCLKQCVENLAHTVDDFKKALHAITASDSYMLGEDLATAASDMAACEMCFDEVTGGNNPLAEFEQAIKSTSADSLSIILDDVSDD